MRYISVVVVVVVVVAFAFVQLMCTTMAVLMVSFVLLNQLNPVTP